MKARTAHVFLLAITLFLSYLSFPSSQCAQRVNLKHLNVTQSLSLFAPLHFILWCHVFSEKEILHKGLQRALCNSNMLKVQVYCKSAVDSWWDVPLNVSLMFVNGSSVAGTMGCVPLREHNRWYNTHGCHAAATGALQPHKHTYTICRPIAAHLLYCTLG